MRSEIEIREDILNAQTDLETIINTGEAEQRELSESENSEMVILRNKIEELNKELNEVIENNKRIKRQNPTNKMEKNSNELRLFDLVKEVANGNISEEHRSFINGNNIDYRAAIQATVATQGKENVPTDKMRLDVAIRNNTVLDKLGVTWVGNAVGDVAFPKYHGSQVAWAGSENAAATDGASAFTQVVLSPKRLTAYIDISRQFLAQSPEDAESILVNDLARAIAEKIDLTVFGTGSGSTSEPAGLFADAASGALASITFDDVLDLENEVEEKNGTDFVFVTSPNIKYALRGVQTASGLQMVWDKGEIDGRNTVVSNSVAKGGLLCFDPRDLACASWEKDGMVITIDTVTRAIYNEIRVVVNYLFDAKLRGERIATKIFE